jgi:hypothetical protein
MSEFKTDSTGQIIGVSHHDGRIRSVTFGAEGQIAPGIRSSAGEDIEVRLLGVGYFVMNEVREGNIVDRSRPSASQPLRLQTSAPFSWRASVRRFSRVA